MKMTTINKRQTAGFTLIELIVTISIATILASLAAPNFSRLIKENRLTAGTNELVSALILARSEALKRSNNVSICASTDQATCSGSDFSTGWVVFVNCDPVLTDGVPDAVIDCTGDGDSTDPEDINSIIKVHGPVKGMNITKTGAASYQSFNFTGRAGLNSTISVMPTGSATPSRQISVNRTGRVKSVDCNVDTCL